MESVGGDEKALSKESLCKRVISATGFVLKNITVEPVMFLFFFSGSLDSISLSQLKIVKSCKIDFGFNDTVCDNLVSGNFSEENDMVQDKVLKLFVGIKDWIF